MISSIVFLVPSLTELRYLIPFSIALNKHMSFIKQHVLIERYGTKYTGLASQRNYELCVEILRMNCPWLVEYENCAIDASVQVESGTCLDVKKRIVMQHAFDCFWIKDKIANDAVYVCGTQMMSNFALDCGIKMSLYAPVPIPFWAYESRPINDKAVTLFYPDSGDVDIAHLVVDMLSEAGFHVFVKQRRKHQTIMCGGEHIYDRSWYPSDGIILPATTRFTVGFGSSAYTDITAVGLHYVNVDVHYTAHPWREFRHPEAQNYMRIMDETSIIESIEHAIMTFKNEPVVIEQDLIRQFLEKLL